MDDLLIEVLPPTAIVTINRPHIRNAISFAIWEAIPKICAQLEGHSRIRVVLFRGAGDEAFSAGADINEFAELRNNKAQSVRYYEVVDKALAAVQSLSKPTIALIKGHCMGGGFLLALHCDLRISSDHARFGIPVAKLGSVLTYPQVQKLLRLLGEPITTDILLTGRILNSEEALQTGICNRIYPVSQIDSRSMEFAQQIAALSSTSHRVHKQMVSNLWRQPDLARLTAEERSLVEDVFDSQDYQEGSAAFIEKRPARFKGR